jgi:hypothetical protein
MTNRLSVIHPPKSVTTLQSRLIILFTISGLNFCYPRTARVWAEEHDAGPGSR